MKGYRELLAGVLISAAGTSLGLDLEAVNGTITLSGHVMAAEDVSAVAVVGSRFIVLGADEGVGDGKNENRIQLLEPIEGGYAVHHDILLFYGNKQDGKEMDIEGIAVDGTTIFVVGSHSSKRSRVKSNETYERNRETFRADKIGDERNRDWLYRVFIDENGNETARERVTLRNMIADDPVLGVYRTIPSKENGVDIEGLAVKNGELYAGLRGPVFRENWVPVIKFSFDAVGTHELLYVNLGGRGIRDMTSVSDGFLIVAGPVGDGPGSYQLYHWDGRDLMVGDNRSKTASGKIHLLGEIRPPEDGKAEGVAVLREDEEGYDILMVYDGVQQKSNIMRRFRVAKPG